jgi:hypothetical protein
LNTYRNITDPLRQGQPKISKSESENTNTNTNNNQGSNQKNSSMTDFFVNQNTQNNNQFLYNNINNQNNITFNNANLQQIQQLQYLQQYLALMNTQQNPQLQNQILQFQQQQMNLQKNVQTINNVNNVNTFTFPNFSNQINPNLQSNIINPQHQNTQSTTKEKEEETNNSNENQQSESNNTNDGKEDVEQSAKYGIITEPYEETRKLDATLLGSEENAIIQVTSPEKIEGGFFTKSYVTYLVTTNPLNLKVRRRYSDFEWFRQILQTLYPYNVIPSTPKKNKIGSDKFGDPFLQKRMRTLEKFLNYLLKNPILKASQILYDFISIEKDSEFKRKKKNMKK